MPCLKQLALEIIDIDHAGFEAETFAQNHSVRRLDLPKSQIKNKASNIILRAFPKVSEKSTKKKNNKKNRIAKDISDACVSFEGLTV